jgi:putative ABC transport system permease protein
VAILRLALRSVWNRRATAGLTVLAVALSTAMLLGVEKLRRDARGAFADTISGTDLVVGARSGPVQLLLYAIFRIGDPTNDVSWESYRHVATLPGVRWAVPISLGDSHRGFRVLGTTREYFEHYRFARRERLRFAVGAPFEGVFDAVLGAEVAARLGYAQGDPVVVAHGAGAVSMVTHEDKPFHVVGILEPTGTPVDRTVHVSLEGIAAMHVDWRAGAPIPALRVTAEEAGRMDLAPQAVTAILVGLEQRRAVLRVQRHINRYRGEPLLAIVPALALQQLWDTMSVAENALRGISLMVVVTGMLGMLTVILSGLEARRREMAVLRSVGAGPLHICGLFVSEAGALALCGAGLGAALLYAGVLVARPFAARELGLYLALTPPQPWDLAILGLVVLAGFVTGCIPALRAYRLSLADGLSMRI